MRPYLGAFYWAFPLIILYFLICRKASDLQIMKKRPAMQTTKMHYSFILVHLSKCSSCYCSVFLYIFTSIFFYFQNVVDKILRPIKLKLFPHFTFCDALYGGGKLHTDQKMHFASQKRNVTPHIELHHSKNEKGNKIFGFRDSSDVTGDCAYLVTTGYSLVLHPSSGFPK